MRPRADLIQALTEAIGNVPHNRPDRRRVEDSANSWVRANGGPLLLEMAITAALRL